MREIDQKAEHIGRGRRALESGENFPTKMEESLLKIYVFHGPANHLHFVGENSTINNSLALAEVGSNKSFSVSQLSEQFFPLPR